MVSAGELRQEATKGPTKGRGRPWRTRGSGPRYTRDVNSKSGVVVLTELSVPGGQPLYTVRNQDRREVIGSPSGSGHVGTIRHGRHVIIWPVRPNLYYDESIII